MAFSNLRPHTDLQGPRTVFEGSVAHAGLTLNKIAIKGEFLLVGVKKGHREQQEAIYLPVLEKETVNCSVRCELTRRKQTDGEGGTGRWRANGSYAPFFHYIVS